MGQNRRTKIREQARNTRTIGETVTLLFEAAPGSSRATPFSLTGSDSAPAISVDTTQTIYAVVTYKPLGDIKFDEGGRRTNTKATVEVPFELGTSLQTCVAVQMQDGSILRKTAIRMTEDRTNYAIDVEGYVAVAQ